MCGIVGILNQTGGGPPDLHILRQMLGTIRHRGPDEFGIYRDAHLGMGSARLSIIDLSGGQQPIGNEDGTLWIVFNGEIFNYLELRPALEARGHRFSTNTDTEVILHLYEDHGAGCLNYLNGQFAIAIWDARRQRLFLARDRVGIRPLFYTIVCNRLIFGSEIKALLVHPDVTAEIDPTALDQIFTYWGTLSPRTVFCGVQDVPPGSYLLADRQQIAVHPYWTLDFDDENSRHDSVQDYLAEFERLLVEAVQLRLRADVPVGAYLSGGLDSSITAAIVRDYVGEGMDTFSIAFEDQAFDESIYQQQMAATLGTNHQVVHCTYADIGRVFPDVVWHTETPVLRTSPAPMFLLSQLVHDHGFKVVLTGEGADEILAGYNVFKEMQVRRFWARNPESQMRPLLLRRLYPYIAGLGTSEAYLIAFFKRGLGDTDSPYYSHELRWKNTARVRRLLLDPARNGGSERPALPPGFHGWSYLAQAQYLEMSVFLSQYLLSSQGDRMAMAHSVEGRFPFLDHRVIEFCNHLPARVKLRGLTEKWLLKQLGRKLVPAAIWQRPKQPYRAPIHPCFFGPGAPEYVEELLSEPALRRGGMFDPEGVLQLKAKAQHSQRLSEVDSMALVGVLSAQIVHHRFVNAFYPPSLKPGDDLKIVDVSHAPQAGAAPPTTSSQPKSGYLLQEARTKG
ncbi:MAG: asparagine synthase (glutamine-hydrolyzing) [Anaerolineae bacterium]|nr:asparagine synthase (glutamine-hydrolyzing) [Anaerolineae bacterium]